MLIQNVDCVRKGYRSEEDAKFALRWYLLCPRAIRPDRVEQSGKLHIKYDFVKGTSPHPNWTEVRDVAKEHLWDLPNSGDLPEIERHVVLDYIKHTKISGAEFVTQRVASVLEFIYHERHMLLPVQAVHGDLTLMNAVRTADGKTVLIDPSTARGMICYQNDMGKLLQSQLTNWEHLKTNQKGAWEPNYEFTEFEPMDVAFCISHWCRLVRHHRTSPHVMKVIPSVLEFLCIRFSEIA